MRDFNSGIAELYELATCIKDESKKWDENPDVYGLLIDYHDRLKSITDEMGSIRDKMYELI